MEKHLHVLAHIHIYFRSALTDTPAGGKKAEKTIQELINGFERTHPRVTHSKLPRAIHKPSVLATIDRRHSYTWGEQYQPVHRTGADIDLSGHEVEKLVKEEISNVQEKINSLKDSLTKCSHDIEMIQREQTDIFQRYDILISRNTPDLKSKKQLVQKEGLTLPPINQRATLTNNCKNDELMDKATKISHIKKIARKRSNELAMREADIEVDKASQEVKATQHMAANQEARKSSKLQKSKEAIRRAIVQSLRKREKSATNSHQNRQTPTADTVHESDSKLTQVLHVHDTSAKPSKHQKK